MPHLKYTTSKGASLLSVAAVVLYATAALAQSAKDDCGPTPVIPLTSEEPPAKIVTYPPLAEPLASRGVIPKTCSSSPSARDSRPKRPRS